MKILIIRFSSIGDIVLTQPVVRRLHEAFPQADLYYLTKPQYHEIPIRFGVPIHVLDNEDFNLSRYQIHWSDFDLVFDLQKKLNSFLAKLKTRSAKRFTYSKQRRLRQRIVAHKTAESIASTLDLYKSALDKAALVLHKPELSDRLNFPALHVQIESNDLRLNKLFTQEDKSYIALFPGANHPTKQYPPESLIEFINQAGDQYHFLLMGSSNEAAIANLIHSRTNSKTTDLCGQFILSELMEVLSKVKAVISNDSGPMHIAAALGKPQIAIFGATHPRLGFKPLNDKAVILSSDLPCQPCSLHGGEFCPLRHFKCMRSILPETLVQSLHKLTQTISA